MVTPYRSLNGLRPDRPLHIDLLISDEQTADTEVDIKAVLNLVASNVPENEYQALMEAEPFTQPRTDLDTWTGLHEALDTAMATLTDRERDLFDALITERCTYEEYGQRNAARGWTPTSKSGVYEAKQQLMLRLQDVLLEYPEIRAYLERNEDCD